MYTVDYFIQKFEAIAEEKWIMEELSLGDQCCALGHCGVRSKDISNKGSITNNDEGKELCKILSVFKAGGTEYENVYKINDGQTDLFGGYLTTPKQRILAALYDIKKMQEVEQPTPVPAEAKTIIRYV